MSVGKRLVLIFSSMLVLSWPALAEPKPSEPSQNKYSPSKLTVEELRIPQAKQALPEVMAIHQARISTFEKQLQQVRNFTALTQVILRHGHAIWQEAAQSLIDSDDYDDRPLYWARLQMLAALKNSKTFQQLFSMQQEELLWKFELLSRGQQDVKFDKKTTYKILLTGFDPFHLDKNIDQSNPSGVAALALDNAFLSLDGQSVEIETLIVPVRFKDFDQGMIESLLQPYFTKEKVDMIITVSMGRSDFDLERFPSLRRSSKAPDNNNVFTGATADNPIVPMLKQALLKGDEFVEFSLPVNAMLSVQTPFKVNDNRTVTTLNKKFAAKSLAELKRETSVQGSGGGYLSNEISYRSLLLRNSYQPVMPVGHIHTPRMSGYNRDQLEQIVKQLKTMLTKASVTLH